MISGIRKMVLPQPSKLKSRVRFSHPAPTQGEILRKDKILSRGPDIDTQKCVRMVRDNKFLLVIVAAQKARELRRHNYDDHGCVTALLEIQAGRVDTQEYLNKRFRQRQPKR